MVSVHGVFLKQLLTQMAELVVPVPLHCITVTKIYNIRHSVLKFTCD